MDSSRLEAAGAELRRRGRVLVDEELDLRLARDGIVGPVPVPGLDREVVDRLRSALDAVVPTSPGFYAMHRPEDSPERRRLYSAAIRDELAHLVMPLLHEQRFFGHCGIFVKQPGDEGRLGLHQDWNFVDERRHMSGSVWVPLVDTDETNGRFHAVLGSHLLGPTYRGSPLWPHPSRDVEDLLESEYLTPFDVPAGSALIYDHRIVHGSFANRGTEPRTAVVLGFLPRSVPMQHYFLAGDGRQFRLTIADDYLLDMVIGPTPAGPGVLDVEEIHVPLRFLSEQDCRRLPRPVSGGAPASA